MEDKINELYNLLNESKDFKGAFTSPDQLRSTLEKNGEEVYNLINESEDFKGAFTSYDEFSSAFLKKKVSSQGSSPKEFTLQSYSQETPITDKDWVGDIAVGAVKPAEKPNYLKIREQNISAIDNLMGTLNKQYDELNATIIEKEKNPAYQASLNTALQGVSGNIPMSGAMLLRQNVREGSSPAKDEIARLKKVAAARDMLLMAKKLNSKSASELNKDQTWLSKLGSSMKNGDWTDVFTMGMQGIENQTELLGALRKAQGAKEDDSVPESLRRNPLDTLTPDEQGLIVAYSMLQEAYSMPDRSVSNMVGENLVSAIPFIIQMAYTGGAGAAVKASFSKIGKELIKK